MDPYSAHSAHGSGARGFVLAIAGLLGAAVGSVGLVATYVVYVAPAIAPPAPAPKAAQPATPPPVLSAGRVLPMPKPDLEAERAASRPARTSGARQAAAMRASDGHFYFDTFVNGTRIRTMFDTGASLISLTAEDAVRIGINTSALDYNVSMSTANGRTTAAYVVLASVRIGDITKNNVEAIVARPGAQSITLLGQSFMSRVSAYRYERSELILTDN